MLDRPVFILTEGFSYTGYGHVSRCLALAQAFRERQVPVTFVVNGDERIRSLLAGYPVYLFDWLHEPERLSDCLENASVLVVDSYLADKAMYERWQGKGTVRVYLDDFNRMEYPEGIVVNGTVGAERIGYRKQEGRTYWLGGAYIILRKAFHELDFERVFSPSIGTVLLTFGGTDPFGMTVRVLDGLVKKYPAWRKLVVVGAAFRQREEVEALADAHTRVFENVDAETMKQLMLTADVALSAAGQTINELAATGLPSVIFKVADNQTNNIAGWKASGFIDAFIDATKEWSFGEVVDCLNRLENPDLRKKLSERGRTAVDGKGSDRIVKKVLHRYLRNTLTVTKAKGKDLIPLFELANDPEVRRNSFSSHAISLEEHTRWFHTLLADPDRILYVFYAGDRLLAQIRLDRKAGVAVVSISLHSFFRGLGLAPVLLRIALQKCKEDFPDVQAVDAYVKAENEASRHAFEKAGFHFQEKDDNQVVKYSYRYENEFIR